MSTIGHYNLLISSDGQYAVEWHNNNQKYLVKLPNLIDKIHEIVQNELTTRNHFAKLFHLAFYKNLDDFVNHPDFIIMDYINNEEVVPDKSLNKEQLFKFNIKRLLLAYNRWKGTSLKFNDVEQLCSPCKTLKI